MKAISPMIAVILLIAFTIGVGGLVSIFVTSLTTTSTGITSNSSESLTKCAGAWININSVKSDRIIYTNPNSQNVTSIQLVGDNMPAASAQVSLISLLTPGQAAANVTGFAAGSNTSFILRGLCQSTVTIEGICKVGQRCWEAS